VIEHAYEIRLAIPDNEAYTALTTLRRLDVPCDGIQRADVYVFGVDDRADAAALGRLLTTIATIYNPNKHRLRSLDRPRPAPGEVWIAAAEMPQPHERVVVGGVDLPGVRTAWRATSWRLTNGEADVPPQVLERAVETLLCNSAFQRAIKP